MSREREIEVAAWVVATCLAFGADVVTAHHVAAVFIEGLRNDTESTETMTKDKRRFRLQDDRGEDILGGAVTIDNVFISQYGSHVGGPFVDKLAVGDCCKKRYAMSGQKPAVYTIVRVEDAEEAPCVV